MKRTTIFRQLILNIVLPAIIAMIILGILNFKQTINILIEACEKKNDIIVDEICHIYEMQELALEMLEDNLQPRMRYFSDLLVKDHFKSTNGIDTVKLDIIRKKTGMNADFEDISVINKKGDIVNTTFKQYSSMNLFDLGDNFRKLFDSVFACNDFVNEKFAIENTTRRLKKYTYQPTLDRKYIIELGTYSKRADSIIHATKKRINDLSSQHENIVSVDLFIGLENPFSLNKDSEIPSRHIASFKKVLANKTEYKFTENNANGRLQYHFIYMGRRNTNLYSESVIRIVSNHHIEKVILKQELFKFFIIFGFTTFIVIILLYRKTRIITEPIRNLVEKVNRIAEGSLHERVDIKGNNEIALLSEQFNRMIDQWERYYDMLEEKVSQRTNEIMLQKEDIEIKRDEIQEQRNILSEVNYSLQEAYREIEEQKKHIEDSIHYARRIQTAILPPEDYVKELIPDSFILYMPKDIVSGDFYWLNESKGKIMVAAVDCTGHGVPGAFMSIVGYNQLNYIINIKGINRPAQVLDAMNQGVTNTLRQTKMNSTIKDGMDVCLVSIDRDTQTL